jgi:hypothetical protein
MYKYDHMFKGIILPALAPSLKAQTDEICNSLVGVLADKDITELGAKVTNQLGCRLIIFLHSKIIIIIFHLLRLLV